MLIDLQQHGVRFELILASVLGLECGISHRKCVVSQSPIPVWPPAQSAPYVASSIILKTKGRKKPLSDPVKKPEPSPKRRPHHAFRSPV